MNNVTLQNIVSQNNNRSINKILLLNHCPSQDFEGNQNNMLGA